MKLLMLLLVIASYNVCAQDIKPLELPYLINIAAENSLDYKIAKYEQERQHYEFKSFGSLFKPELTLTGNAIDYSKDYFAVRQPDGTLVFQPRTQNYSALGLGLSQLIPQTGGTIAVNTNLTRFDDFERGEQQYSGVPVNVTLSQPFFAFNEFKWLKKIEPLKYLQSQKKFKAEKEKISLQTTHLFFNLLDAQSSYDIALKNIESQKLIYKIESARINLGTTTEDKLLQIELQVLDSETQLNKAKVNILTAMNELRNFVGLTDTGSMKLIIPQNLPKINLNKENAIALAKNNREEFTGYLRRKLEAQRDLEKEKRQKYKINLGVSYGYSSIGDRLGYLYRNANSQQNVLLQVVIPIIDFGKTKERINIAKSSLSTLNLTIEQEEIALVQEISELMDSFQYREKSIQIAKQAEMIANKRYDLTTEQFRYGKTTVTELSLALSDKDNAKRSYLTAVRDYWEEYYQIKCLTLIGQ